MNGNDQLDRLFAAARQSKPDTARVEYGFETRLLARLRAQREQPALWAAWTWRLVPAFAAVVLALGVWNYAAPVETDLTALAGDPDQELVAYYAGE
jgi:hypothetical protein